MKIITDSIDFSRTITPTVLEWTKTDKQNIGNLPSELINAVYTDNIDLLYGETNGLFDRLLLVESAGRSHYDILIELARANVALPDMTLCLAGEGAGFHGFKGRSWVSPPGNIYLCVHFAPNRPIENFGVGFMILAAVAVVQAIDRVDDLRGRAGIKWVNDILIDNAKICGVLAHCLTEGDTVTNAILGIGLNVGTTPTVKPNLFVPRTASLHDFVSASADTSQAIVLQNLIGAIAGGYHILLEDGYRSLLRFYRERSLILGRDVAVYSDRTGDNDTLLVEGIVEAIGDNLELYFKHRPTSVNSGRLLLKS
ncbi:MAG TPA: biotin--[acetyl-CoA-carboxylase] ligase [candidate division Zixibacteria bacterium]|nr:biotin--[acetyl-CoA-carboxylase] ligase [candidate division Zixibacteria bacterium]